MLSMRQVKYETEGNSMPAFAKRMEYLAGSAAIIRGLFGAINDPETISFGGGAPASDALPVEQIREIAFDVLKRDTRGVEALQYGPVRGIRRFIGNPTALLWGRSPYLFSPAFSGFQSLS